MRCGGGQVASFLLLCPRALFFRECPCLGLPIFCAVWRLKSTWLNVLKFNRLLVAEYLVGKICKWIELNKPLPFAVWADWCLLLYKYCRVKESWVLSQSVISRKSSWPEMESLLDKQGNLSWAITELGPSMQTLEPPRAAEKQVHHREFSAGPADENPNRSSLAKLHSQRMLFLYAIIYHRGL